MKKNTSASNYSKSSTRTTEKKSKNKSRTYSRDSEYSQEEDENDNSSSYDSATTGAYAHRNKYNKSSSKSSMNDVQTSLDSVVWTIDGRHLCNILYTLMKNAKDAVYISASSIDWNLILNEDPKISLLEMIIFLCNVSEVSVFILMGERMFLEQKIPDQLTQLQNFVVKTIPQFGPLVKDEIIPWVPSVEEWVSKTTSIGISELNNMSISKMGSKGIYEYNQSYVLIDTSFILLGAFDLDHTLSGCIEHIHEDMIKEQLMNLHSQLPQLSTEGTMNEVDPNIDDTSFSESTFPASNFQTVSASNFPTASGSNWKTVPGSNFPTAAASNFRVSNQILIDNQSSISLQDAHDVQDNTSISTSILYAPFGLISKIGSMLCCNWMNFNSDPLQAMPNVEVDNLKTSPSKNNNSGKRIKCANNDNSDDFQTLAYHRVCSVIRPTYDMVQFVLQNWDTMGNAVPVITPWSDLKLTGSFAHEQSELYYIVQFVQQCKEFLYIETSHLNSSLKTDNKFIECVVDRLITAHEKCLLNKNQFDIDPFRVVIFTNANFTKGTIFDKCMSQHTNQTEQYIVELISNRGYEMQDFKNRLFIGYLMNKHQYIVIKSTVVIQDETRALLTSANLNDRSLMKLNKELGIVLNHHERVADLRQYLWRDHLQFNFRYNEGKYDDVEHIFSPEEFFQACNKEYGNIQRFSPGSNPVGNTYGYAMKCLSEFLGKNIRR